MIKLRSYLIFYCTILISKEYIKYLYDNHAARIAKNAQ